MTTKHLLISHVGSLLLDVCHSSLTNLTTIQPFVLTNKCQRLHMKKLMKLRATADGLNCGRSRGSYPLTKAAIRASYGNLVSGQRLKSFLRLHVYKFRRDNLETTYFFPSPTHEL